MRISVAKTLMKRCVEKKVNVSFLFIGSMGIGKSAIWKQITDELNMGLVDLRLAQLEPGDIIGVPRSDEATGRTVWRKPEWWPNEGTSGVIHLDELNRAPVDVRQAVFQLVLDKKMHTHTLPSGWYVHASVNPDNGNYQVEQLDQAMTRRFCNIKLVPNIDDWAAYWHKTHAADDPHADLISRFIFTNEKLFSFEETFEIDVKYNPDGYRMVWELMNAGVLADEAVQSEVVQGLIGKEAAVAFIAFMDKRYIKPVSGKEILSEYPKVQAQVKRQQNAEMYTTLHDLIAILKNYPNIDTTDKPLTPIHERNLVQFVLDINEESRSTLVMGLPTNSIIGQLSKHQELVEAFRQFMEKV